jgi:hypothetical protein
MTPRQERSQSASNMPPVGKLPGLRSRRTKMLAPNLNLMRAKKCLWECRQNGCDDWGQIELSTPSHHLS